MKQISAAQARIVIKHLERGSEYSRSKQSVNNVPNYARGLVINIARNNEAIQIIELYISTLENEG